MTKNLKKLIRRGERWLYRYLVTPQVLKRLRRNGNSDLARVFREVLKGRFSGEEEDWRQRIESLRSELLRSPVGIEVVDYGARSAGLGGRLFGRRPDWIGLPLAGVRRPGLDQLGPGEVRRDLGGAADGFVGRSRVCRAVSRGIRVVGRVGQSCAAAVAESVAGFDAAPAGMALHGVAC